MKKKTLSKQDFIKCVIISSILTAMVIAVIIGFFVVTSKRYSMPNEENASLVSDTVTKVYQKSYPNSHPTKVIVEMENGDSLQLVYPWSVRTLYSTIGYDITQLAELIEGENIEYLRMNGLSYIVRIYVNDIVIDNSKLTEEYIVTVRIGGVILGLIILALPIGGDIYFLKSKYKCYKKSEKRRLRKSKNKTKEFQNS